jgi:hypothetical protein
MPVEVRAAKADRRQKGSEIAMWKRIREMKLSEGLYWLLIFLVIMPQIIIFIFSLSESIYYSISAGNTLISFYLVFRYSYAFLFKGDNLAEQPWIYVLFWLGVIAIMTVVKYRKGTTRKELEKV